MVLVEGFTSSEAQELYANGTLSSSLLHYYNVKATYLVLCYASFFFDTSKPGGPAFCSLHVFPFFLHKKMGVSKTQTSKTQTTDHRPRKRRP